MKIKKNTCSVLAGFLFFIAFTGCDDIISEDVNEEFFIGPGQKAELDQEISPEAYRIKMIVNR